MENLLLNLELWLKSPVKERTDFKEHKFSRSKQNEKRLQQYKSEIPSMKILLAQRFLLKDEGDFSLPDSDEADREECIKPEQYYTELKQYQKDGKTFQNGDVFFFQEAPTSQMKEFYDPDLPSSPCGIISIINDRFFLMKVDRGSDFQVIPLYEVLTAQRPVFSKLSFFRFYKTLDEKEITYLLKILNNCKDQIIFDPYYVRNPKIKNPEKYFLEYPFLYPTELIYLFYDYLNNHEETLSSDRFSTREIFKRYNKTNPVQDSYFKKTDKEEYEKNQFVIFPAHIIKSPYFKLIYEINCEKFKK